MFQSLIYEEKEKIMKELKERTKNYCDRMIEVAVNGDECTKQDLTIEVCKFGKDLGKVIENLERERDYLLG